MTTLTLTTLAAIVFGMVNRRGYGMALALAGATPVGAALAAGGNAVPTFYAVAIGAAIGLLARHVRAPFLSDAQEPAWFPGATPLLLLTVFSILVTLISPFLFDGVGTLNAEGTPNQRLSAGFVSTSNIAQIVYLVLGVLVIAFLARARWAGVELVGIAVCGATILSAWAWLGIYAGIPFPQGFFDNSPAFKFIETEAGGAPRFRGIFSEPASMATSSLMTAAYCFSRMHRLQGVRRVFTLSLGFVAVALGAVSTSATFFVAGVAVLALAIGVTLFQAFRQRHLIGFGTVAFVLVAFVAASWLLPVAANYLGEVVDDKVSSTSYDERSSSDEQSIVLFFSTYGFGVGLGANRGSSLVTSLLSSIGLVGFCLLVAAIWTLLRESAPDRTVRPAAWVLAALLISKVISGPDLADSGGIIWLTLGVLARSAVIESASGRGALQSEWQYLARGPRASPTSSS